MIGSVDENPSVQKGWRIRLLIGSKHQSFLSILIGHAIGKSVVESCARERTGIQIDGDVRFTMSARITALDIGGYRSELRTDVSVGSTWQLASEYYRPLTPTSMWFVAPRFAATSSPFDFYDRSEQIADYRIRQVGGGFDLGYEINRFSEIRLGYDAGYLETKLAVGDPVYEVDCLIALRPRRIHMNVVGQPHLGNQGNLASGNASAIRLPGGDREMRRLDRAGYVLP